MGATASSGRLEESLFLPSIHAKPSSELQVQMEGGADIAALVRSKVVANYLGQLEDLEAKLAQANELAPTLRSALGGLRLHFALKSGVTRRDLLKISFSRVLGSAVVVIDSETDKDVKGSPRVTTPRGFTWLFLAMQDISSAMSSLQVTPQSDTEECPICMDRRVSVALACGHAFCKVCQVEWLVGEGRGTCPMCRSHESERNEWVLGDVEPDEVVVAHAEATVSRVLCFLSHLPTASTFAQSFQIPFGGAALWQPSSEEDCNDSPRDVLKGWLRAEISNSADAPRCTRCDAAMRVPETAQGDSRLLCEGCSALLSVKDLAPGNGNFFRTLGKSGSEMWRL